MRAFWWSAAVLITLAAIAFVPAMNMAGLCIQNGRYVPDKELFVAALRVAGSKDIAEIRETSPELSPATVAAQYLANNPGCCSLWTDPEGPQVDTEQRLMAINDRLVLVRASEGRLDKENVPKYMHGRPVGTLVTLDNCAKYIDYQGVYTDRQS